MTAPEEGISFSRKLQDNAAADPDGVALVVVARDGGDQSLTWSDLDTRANRWCRALTVSGVELGSRVALAVPNSVELVLATLGTWKDRKSVV